MVAAEHLITANLDIWSSAVKTKSAAGRGKSNKLELYGIKKLRELILELAVRGLLVQQDPSDEPASELIKKIAAEKAKLVKAGKIKKQKALQAIKNDEKPFELAAGWEWVKLGELLDRISNGFSGKQDKSGVGFPITRIETISDSKVNLEKVGYSNSIPEEKKEYFRLDQGDILLSHINSDYHVGKTALFEGGQDLYHGVNLLLLRPSKLACPRYIDLSINQLRLSGYFLSIAQHAIGQSSVNQKKVLETFLTIPPLAEQKRIVAKVDELMALCDQLEQQQETSITAHQTLVQNLLDVLTTASGRDGFTAAWARIAAHFDTLFTTEWSIDQLKQTILQLAVMGKLVPQDPNDKPANKLLKRKKAMNDNDIPFKLPDSWAWASVNEFAETRLGKMLDKAKNKGTPYRYLRNINVRWFDFDLSDVKEMRFEDSELEEFTLYRGDVLICEGGYPGRAAVWDERETNIYFQKAIHRVRFQNGVNPNYFVIVLRESADSGRLTSYFTGAGIQHFTGKGLKSFLVPLPPLTEQGHIVAKVDELMALCDDLNVRIQGSQAIQAQLADAVIVQAVA